MDNQAQEIQPQVPKIVEEGSLDFFRNAFSEISVQEKKIQHFPSELTVGEHALQQFQLPGNCSIDVCQQNGMTLRVWGKKGEQESVHVGKDGAVTTRPGVFNSVNQGDRQVITTPSGQQVVVRDGRIVEATTGGQRTEFLTPAEAKQRQAERALQEEQRLNQTVAEVTQGIADTLVQGNNIPVGNIREAFTNAAIGLYGKSFGATQLARDINQRLRDQDSRMRVALVEDRTNNTMEVRVHGDRGVVTTIPIDLDIFKKAK
jgi:hypothetical protein